MKKETFLLSAFFSQNAKQLFAGDSLCLCLPSLRSVGHIQNPDLIAEVVCSAVRIDRLFLLEGHLMFKLRYCILDLFSSLV